MRRNSVYSEAKQIQNRSPLPPHHTQIGAQQISLFPAKSRGGLNPHKKKHPLLYFRLTREGVAVAAAQLRKKQVQVRTYLLR